MLRTLLKRALITQPRAIGVRSESTLPPNLAKAYAKFQVDDGVPVYLKGGFGDRVLVSITVALLAYGLFDGALTLYSMAKRKKKQ